MPDKAGRAGQPTPPWGHGARGATLGHTAAGAIPPSDLQDHTAHHQGQAPAPEKSQMLQLQ